MTWMPFRVELPEPTSMPWTITTTTWPVDPIRPDGTDDEPWPLYPVNPPRHIPWRWLALALVLLIAWRIRNHG